MGTAVLACLRLVPSHGLRVAAMAVILTTVVRLGGSLVIVAHALRALHSHKAEDEHYGLK